MATNKVTNKAPNDHPESLSGPQAQLVQDTVSVPEARQGVTASSPHHPFIGPQQCIAGHGMTTGTYVSIMPTIGTPFIAQVPPIVSYPPVVNTSYQPMFTASTPPMAPWGYPVNSFGYGGAPIPSFPYGNSIAMSIGSNYPITPTLLQQERDIEKLQHNIDLMRGCQQQNDEDRELMRIQELLGGLQVSCEICAAEYFTDINIR